MPVNKKNGFSIIEIFLTIFILGIVSAMGAMTYTQWRQRTLLANETEELQSIIMQAQQLATASAGSSDWGLHLENDNYILFSGESYNPLDAKNKLWTLKNSLIVSPTTTFADGLGGRQASVVFAKFTGTTNNTGTIFLMSRANSNFIKSIIVDSSGQAY